MDDGQDESPPTPKRIVEALLFVGGQPLTAHRAGEVVRNLKPEQFAEIVEGLNRDYRKQKRPYSIQAAGDGWQLQLKPTFREVRSQLAASPREAKLTQTALDVLALVAYRQPVGKVEIDSQRGSDSRAPLQQLVRLGLIAVEQQPSGESAYVTAPRFLELFGLQSLDDLPRTGDLQRL